MIDELLSYVFRLGRGPPVMVYMNIANSKIETVRRDIITPEVPFNLFKSNMDCNRHPTVLFELSKIGYDFSFNRISPVMYRVYLNNCAGWQGDKES